MFQIIFQVDHGASNDGYAAVDKISFDYTEAMRDCAILPPEADVKHTTPDPNTTPEGETFPDCDFDVDECGWLIDGYTEMKWFITNTIYLNDAGFDSPKEDFDGDFIYVNAVNGNNSATTIFATPMTERAPVEGCMNFYFSIQVK